MPLRLVVVAATVVTLALLAGAPPAGAVSCTRTLTDGLNFRWQLEQDGSLKSGGKPGSEDPYGSTNFDVFGSFGVNSESGGFGGTSYTGTASGCTLTQNGREVLYPEEALTGVVAGLRASRRVYVPPASAPRSFARWIDTIRNPTNATRTVDMGWSGGLGSDCGTRVSDESSGNEQLDERDHWAVTYDTAPGDDTCSPVFGTPNDDNSTGLPLAHNWDGPTIPVGGTAAAGFTEVFDLNLVPGGGYLLGYHDIAIGPGQSASFVHFETQTTTIADDTGAAANAANALDSEPPELFAGMSAADLAKVRNWCAHDCDHDTKPDTSDNCRGVANTSQLDTDKDKAGDACDTDDDNDGRSDATELALGTSPTSAKDAPPNLTKLTVPKHPRVGKSRTVKASASDDYGVRSVAFWIGNKRLCVDRTAPYSCKWKPSQPRKRAVTAVASDAIGQVALRSKSVKVKR